MPSHTRLTVLLGVLAVSAALAAWGDKSGSGRADAAGLAVAARDGQGEREAGPAARDREAGSGAAAEEPMIQAIQPRTAAPEVAKAFAVRDWTPPPPPIPVEASSAPPAPTAPPLPFAFLGKQLEDGNWQVFLGEKDKTYIVREADLIDGIYRVDAIRPPAMVFTYIPLQLQQSLAIGDSP